MRAWSLGLAFFAACWIVAGLAGVSDLLDEPLGHGPVDRAFVALWVVALAAAVVGYWVIWPMGTHTEGRPLRVIAAGVFGVLHGISEGILYVVMWLGIERWVNDPAAVVAATVTVIGVFNGSWRTFVWDVWVTPPHNIESWNARKVLFVHLPVVTLAVVHLTAFGSVAVFLSIQVVALTGAAVHMRFPSPFASGERQTAI